MKKEGWWDKCITNDSLDEANLEINFMRQDWQKIGEVLGYTHFVDPEVIIEDIASLRADAEKYRWLLENGKPAVEYLTICPPDNWNVVIDYAMKTGR